MKCDVYIIFLRPKLIVYLLQYFTVIGNASKVLFVVNFFLSVFVNVRTETIAHDNNITVRLSDVNTIYEIQTIKKELNETWCFFSVPDWLEVWRLFCCTFFIMKISYALCEVLLFTDAIASDLIKKPTTNNNDDLICIFATIFNLRIGLCSLFLERFTHAHNA